LTPDIWTVRVRLQLEGRMRDLAMFNLAIDSKLRDCDLYTSIWVRIDDVCAGGRVRDRATVVQKKTGRPSKHSNGVAAWSRSMTFTSGRRPRKAVFRQISFSTKHYRVLSVRLMA
jgi:hypothetical protein